MTIDSNTRTFLTTQTHDRSADNSSLRTSISLQELFNNNPRSVISEMAGNISRVTLDTKSSLRAHRQSQNSEITCRLLPTNAILDYKENEVSIRNRQKAKKTFIELQSNRLNQEKNNIENSDNQITILKLKKRTLEFTFFKNAL
jgi:hypothetical protein